MGRPPPADLEPRSAQPTRLRGRRQASPPLAPVPMPLKPDTFAMTMVLALLTALGPLSTDMYLPSLPAIAADLGATTAGAQLTLSAFLLGFAVGQFVYGPVSDRIGRKPVLLFGLG